MKLLKRPMKTTLLLLSLLILFGCATNKDPVWSEYYYPQEVLLKPAPKAESSRVQGKSTFLQNEAEFKERIPLSNDHHHGVSHSELMRRLEALEPYLDLGFHQFAQTAIKDQNLDNLRLPRQNRREINLNEDLLAG
jgi:hypothetical protein